MDGQAAATLWRLGVSKRLSPAQNTPPVCATPSCAGPCVPHLAIQLLNAQTHTRSTTHPRPPSPVVVALVHAAGHLQLALGSLLKRPGVQLRSEVGCRCMARRSSGQAGTQTECFEPNASRTNSSNMRRKLKRAVMGTGDNDHHPAQLSTAGLSFIRPPVHPPASAGTRHQCRCPSALAAAARCSP